ncbi:MAG: ankyrin repeat domain-containing protein [Rickettsia sp.]|nr:ankyrin repeat domain-containing protein [Rickettsia sp.]
MKKIIILSLILTNVIYALSDKERKEAITQAAEKDNLEQFLYYSQLNGTELEVLIYASRYDAIKIAEFAIKSGANVNQQNKKGWTALMSSAYTNSYNVCNLLIKAGADINLTQQNGWTALMFAAATKNSQEVTELLIKLGAIVDQQNDQGETALIIASKFGNISQAKILLKAGANVNQKDNKGNTSLLTPIQNSLLENYNVYSLEQEREFTGTMGHLILDPDALKAEPKLINMLVRFGAEINVQNINGQTPLIQASESNDYDRVRYLIHHKADINYQDNLGQTALMVALKVFQKSKIFDISEAGMNTYDIHRDSIENRVFIDFSKGEDQELISKITRVVVLLIQSGADVNHRDKNLFTPLILLENYKSPKLAEIFRKILLSAGATA